MKKSLIVALAVIMAGTMTACGMGDVGGASSTATSQAASSAVVSQISADAMDDNLAGLEKYLAANSFISGQPVQMQPEFIGAKSGAKYQFGFDGNNNVTVELYEYDTANLNDTAKSMISEVKSKGKYSIMGQEVAAVLSDSGKYLMIYKDSAAADKNKAHQQEVTKLFQGFKQ